MVVAPEERLHFVELHGVQVRHFADRRPVIRMFRREQRRQERHRREPVRTVLVILTALVQHDVALVRELRLGERRQQIAHAVGFHPERELERVRRDDFPIVGAIGVGRSVERRARALQRFEVPAIVVLRSFEHQMLEEMREACVPRALVLRADVIPEIHRDDRTRAILMEEHVESVGQRVLRERQRHRNSPQVSIELP